nr:MAG TPA: Initiation-control protein YabA, DnaA, DnaN, Zinc finger.7A [Caudoviricetes sp.]
MSIWHNEAIPTTEKDKYVYVEFYTQIPYTDRETLSRCVTLSSDCGDLEEPDLIRWCYLDDLLAQQAEINRLREEKSEIEIELKNTEQTCYGWQRLVESLEEQNNQLKAENDKLREALKSVKQQTINLRDYEEIGAIATISDICDKALNGKSEGK